MRYAVHSLHAKVVEVCDDGSYTLNGNDRIRLGEALFVGESADEAERWRADMIEQRSLGHLLDGVEHNAMPEGRS